MKSLSLMNPVLVAFLLIGLSFLFVLLFNLDGLDRISIKSIPLFIKNITLDQSLLISASIQLTMLTILFVLLKKKLFKLASCLLLSDLVVNTLLCTPYFSVGSYTIKDVENIYHSQRGFPVQQELVNKVPAAYRDPKGNPWNNVNVFSKEISSNDSYRGPLTLEQFSTFSEGYSSETFNKAVVSAHKELPANQFKTVVQQPDHIRVVSNFVGADSITLWQNYYPGWSAYYNGKQINLGSSSKTGIAIFVLPGEATIDFTYKRNGVIFSAIFLHLITISFLLWKLYVFFRPRSSLLSLHGNTDSLVH